MSMFLRWLYGKSGFVASNVLVMIILHGNSRQFWPKIPVLSLRDESVFEHCRLLFNTLLLVTLGQLALRRLTDSRRLPRVCTLIALPLALPLLIAFGQRVLRLQGRAGETYNLALVPLLPIGAAALEDGLVARVDKRKH
ncbi:MAG: hypothetical protein GFH27_549309n121 [Chloroflexi bacterium AL-W]|nr:hypothetical protein [Chloroflexi bacterium AL-N1]NOK69823.1 hypothetical protein [Chloroflexi bacterium AL-N10]NOK73573.1 hypothetical protein [Chloroflexi bacterium AL-N5]NOK83993.1 hypothetical protein [Chloroflexi bacterium AL-W]NOK87904.1 hypothetical protein [Chloroflexi bacterium AL-N15]